MRSCDQSGWKKKKRPGGTKSTSTQPGGETAEAETAEFTAAAGAVTGEALSTTDEESEAVGKEAADIGIDNGIAGAAGTGVLRRPELGSGMRSGSRCERSRAVSELETKEDAEKSDEADDIDVGEGDANAEEDPG